MLKTQDGKGYKNGSMINFTNSTILLLHNQKFPDLLDFFKYIEKSTEYQIKKSPSYNLIILFILCNLPLTQKLLSFLHIFIIPFIQNLLYSTLETHN